jgi:hypothetical protein
MQFKKVNIVKILVHIIILSNLLYLHENINFKLYNTILLTVQSSNINHL